MSAIRGSAIVIIAVSSVVSCRADVELHAGMHVPPALEGAISRSDTVPTVLVLLDAHSCLGCETPAYYLRQAASNPAIRLRIATISERDRDSIVAGFLHDQRLPNAVMTLHPDQYRDIFGQQALPCFVVAKNDSIIALGPVKTIRPELVTLKLDTATSSYIH